MHADNAPAFDLALLPAPLRMLLACFARRDGVAFPDWLASRLMLVAIMEMDQSARDRLLHAQSPGEEPGWLQEWRQTGAWVSPLDLPGIAGFADVVDLHYLLDSVEVGIAKRYTSRPQLRVVR